MIRIDLKHLRKQCIKRELIWYRNDIQFNEEMKAKWSNKPAIVEKLNEIIQIEFNELNELIKQLGGLK